MAEKTIFAGIKPYGARRAIHRVAVVAYDGVVLGDLAIPVEIFARVRDQKGRACYDVKVCAATHDVHSTHLHLKVPCRTSFIARADTVVVPGIDDLKRAVPPAIVTALRGAFERGARIASICTGAFVLARAGLLKGLRATTHWMAAGELARRHPNIDVDPNVLYVDNGQVLTSAGAAAGMDLCLHMIRRDHGALIASAVARAAVMPLERSGGQAQFIQYKLPDGGESMGPLLLWMESNLKQDLPLAVVARHARMSTRTLWRRFHEQVGITPAQWLARARVRCAQRLLESTRLSIDRVAAEAGFGSASVLREHFANSVGTSPTEYRRSFGVDSG